MTLHDFRMPPFLTRNLYHQSLVDLETKENKTRTHKELQSLGDNRKNILIIVDDESAIYLQEADLNFLMGILNACNLSLEDTALINLNNNPLANHKTLLAHFKPETIICFGINLSKLEFPLEFPFYQVQQYNKQVYLAAPSLKTLALDKKEKQQLWNCLKKIFLIQISV